VRRERLRRVLGDPAAWAWAAVAMLALLPLGQVLAR